MKGSSASGIYPLNTKMFSYMVSETSMCCRVILDELVQGCMEWAMGRDMPVLIEGRHYGTGRGDIGGALIHFTLYNLPEKVSGVRRWPD